MLTWLTKHWQQLAVALVPLAAVPAAVWQIRSIRQNGAPDPLTEGMVCTHEFCFGACQGVGPLARYWVAE